MKTFTGIMNSLMVFLFVAAIALIAFNQSAANFGDNYHDPHVPTPLEQKFIKGECWTGGEGHPLPSSMVFTDGTVKRMVGNDFDNALAGKIPNLRGFCA